MNKQQLQQKLLQLQLKWKGKVPKSNHSKDYWKYKCDRCIAIGIKAKLERIEKGLEPEGPSIWINDKLFS